jgi:hypothetical protein
MRQSIWISVALAGALTCGKVAAQAPETTPQAGERLPAPQSVMPGQAQSSGQPATPGKQPQQQPPTAQAPKETQPTLSPESLSQAPTTGAEAPAGFSPNMMGDQAGVFALRTILVPSFAVTTTTQTMTQTTQSTTQVPTVVTINQGQLISVFNPDTGKFTVQPSPFTFQLNTTVPQTNTQTTTQQTPITTTTPTAVRTTVRVPIGTLGAFKIAENESPRPEDRVFFTYNFYSDFTGPIGGLNVPRTDTFITTINGNPATISTFVPAVAPRVDLHREVFGFEKTFLDGYASIGLRAPVIEQPGGGDFGISDFGDITVISKLALWRDIPSGDVYSVGLAVTTPTGPSIDTVAGNIHSTLFQPYTGFVRSDGGLYIQGFSSVVVPTDNRDVILLFNDLGAGYQFCRETTDCLIRSVGPAVEAHITTPLNHREATAPIQIPDLVVFTEGVHVGFYNHSTLTLGLAEPVTGPRPFDFEAFAQFNLRF